MGFHGGCEAQSLTAADGYYLHSTGREATAQSSEKRPLQLPCAQRDLGHLTSRLVHLHASELVLPRSQLTVHLLVAVVAMLVLLNCLIPHHLHLLHGSLVLHDHIIHLLHLGEEMPQRARSDNPSAGSGACRRRTQRSAAGPAPAARNTGCDSYKSQQAVPLLEPICSLLRLNRSVTCWFCRQKYLDANAAACCHPISPRSLNITLTFWQKPALLSLPQSLQAATHLLPTAEAINNQLQMGHNRPDRFGVLVWEDSVWLAEFIFPKVL